MNEFVVYFSKAKLLLLVIGAFIFVILGYILLTISINSENQLHLGILGGLSIVFFGFTIGYAIKKIFSSKPAVIVNAQGITDYSTSIGAGLIEWQDISDVNFVPFLGNSFLGVFTHDQHLIINRTKGIKKLLNKLNKPLVKSQINIVYQNLKCCEDELLDQINHYWQAHLNEVETSGK